MRSIRTTQSRPTDGGHSWDRNDRGSNRQSKRTEIDKMLYEAPDRRNFIFGGLLGVGAGVYGMKA